MALVISVAVALAFDALVENAALQRPECWTPVIIIVLIRMTLMMVIHTRDGGDIKHEKCDLEGFTKSTGPGSHMQKTLLS